MGPPAEQPSLFLDGTQLSNTFSNFDLNQAPGHFQQPTEVSILMDTMMGQSQQ